MQNTDFAAATQYAKADTYGRYGSRILSHEPAG